MTHPQAVVGVDAELRRLRRKLSMSNADIAAFTGYSESMVKAWFSRRNSARHRTPRRSVILALQVLEQSEGKID